jgi:cyclopropane fatty-acyl-phospholipid synthase-like methyltransferase
MIGLHHPKGQRLVSSMVAKYSLLLPFLKEKSKVLEACCGAGFGSALLAASGHHVIGVDFDEKAINFAKKRDGPEFICCDISNFNDQEFDAIVFVDALEHFEKDTQPTILSKLYARLKSGGIILIDTPLAIKSAKISKHHVWELSKEDFSSRVNDMGEWMWTRHFFIDNTYSYPIMTENFPPEIHGVQDQIIVARKI